MFSITNEKVAGFIPQWAEFRGFSILFDSPSNCFTQHAECFHLTCNMENDPPLGFFRNLRDSLAGLKPALLTNTYLFCPLPPPSYHVTAWDGGNQGNLEQVTRGQHPKLRDYLAQLPGSLHQTSEMTEMVLASPLISRRDWHIEFQFAEVAIWSGVVLVARLAPTEAACGAFDEFIAERRRLNAAYRQAFGIGASENFTPHVSLGYFANREGAQLATPCLPEWNTLFAERMRDSTLSFDHASLYGFTDMATFFTAASAVNPAPASLTLS